MPAEVEQRAYLSSEAHRHDALRSVTQYSCSICGSCGFAACVARRATWTYVRCNSCGGISLSPVPDEEALSAYYNELYMVPAAAYARATARNAPMILQALRERLPDKGKLLEVGCSYGFLLDRARRDGWETTGVELDDGASSYGRQKLGLKILSGALENQFAQLTPPYDAVATFHVIEHLRDPIAFLVRCRQLLREGGILILKTPNVESWIARRTGAYWQWLCPPAHLHLFSPGTLGLALAKTGFRAEKMWSRRGDAYNNFFELACAAGRYAASRKSGAAGGKQRKTWSDKWHVNAAKLASEGIYYPLGLVVDPWLAGKMLQPELVAIARA